jgi:hypothetical protein
MGLLQCRTDLAQVMHNSLGRHRTVAVDHLLQIHSRQKLHDVIKRAVLRMAVIVNFNCVLVRQQGSGLNFALKAGNRLGVVRFLRLDQLDGTTPLQQMVFGQKISSIPPELSFFSSVYTPTFFASNASRLSRRKRCEPYMEVTAPIPIQSSMPE